MFITVAQGLWNMWIHTNTHPKSDNKSFIKKNHEKKKNKQMKSFSKTRTEILIKIQRKFCYWVGQDVEKVTILVRVYIPEIKQNDQKARWGGRGFWLFIYFYWVIHFSLFPSPFTLSHDSHIPNSFRWSCLFLLSI